jgi:hypothetical protein
MVVFACYSRHVSISRHDEVVKENVDKMSESGTSSRLSSAFNSLDSQGGNKVFGTKNAVSGETVNTNGGKDIVSMVTVANKGQRERELKKQIEKLKKAKQ